MECPVCLTYLRPPIQICSSGQSMCHTCRQRVAICSTCRAKLTTSRNVALENRAKRVTISL
ncbi:E3 ubiquitin-protein ligase siah2 [Blattella germanica]|nr:E3 ubiquitin-protein ligase siah2 [Blattella germanica]